jgi:hypothetical protein
MAKYHYELHIDLTAIEAHVANHMFGTEDSVNLSLNTNTRLVKDELISVRSNGCLINLEITKINRYIFELNDDNELIEMDMTNPWGQDNRPISTNDQSWFECKANALQLTVD